MRQVIAAAKLEKLAAERLGKEAALYVPSGTMSNLIAIGTHCSRGDEIICGNRAHIFLYEGGGASVPNQPDGTLAIQDMFNAIRSDDPHYPRSKLVAIENTQNFCGGRILPLAYIREVEQFCHEHDLRLHVDGARLANASVATGIPMDALVSGADSVSLCLSKGLGAPVGSILAGSNEFIHYATRLRKSLGGGMRQAGIIAAAGLYALEHQFDRLVEDHVNAQAFAHGIATIPGIEIDPDDVDTNIVLLKVPVDAKLDAMALTEKLESEKGVLVGGYADGNRIRAVTNLHVSSNDIDYTIAAIRQLLLG
uniref:Aromatic amino acid beta-eliminating lyase/threonine aldolase domain-containing protein n=1 Tax=Hyaloperonospora arabidopsidis (strain Emoy2) TaxID=559515 RepID=M4BAC3_HYAAE